MADEAPSVDRSDEAVKEKEEPVPSTVLRTKTTLFSKVLYTVSFT
jgi:hypothetical protein